MLNVFADRRTRDCDGMTRRDFLKVGTLGTAGLTLPSLLAGRSERVTSVQRPPPAALGSPYP